MTNHFIENTHRENTPLNKTIALIKSTNMRISEIGGLNQPFIRSSCTEIKC